MKASFGVVFVLMINIEAANAIDRLRYLSVYQDLKDEFE